ncbi:hypothetical protein PB2503_05577 [Parvularcula bermudensis HTCC2503]|uniref:YbjN domain-containing protein n=2 Tax=Parvularcula TaxID=208215 RepID=E0TGE5_PARBH|nr:hypothetical protein PB2503_05577 [Parvularcula bermudensis HTCC2503]
MGQMGDRRMVKTKFSALALAALMPMTAAAQSNALTAPDSLVSNPTSIVPSLHAEALLPILDELGLDYQGATLPDGRRIILAAAPNGLKFQLTPTACENNNKRCRGLHLLSLFETNAPSRTVAAFNYRYAFVSTGVDDSGVAYVSRYDIADYGTPKGNIAVSIANYLHMASTFDRHLFEATQTVQKEALDTDLAANGLNMQGILADGDLAAQIGLSPSSHQVSFEAMTDVVDTFIKADGLAPGRIVNAVTGKR